MTDIISNVYKPGGDRNTVLSIAEILGKTYPNQEFKFQEDFENTNINIANSVAVLTVNNIKDETEKQRLTKIADLYRNSDAPIIISANRVDSKLLNSQPLKSLLAKKNTVLQTLEINQNQIPAKYKGKTVFTQYLPASDSQKSENTIQQLHSSEPKLRNLNTVMLPGLVNDKSIDETKAKADLKIQLGRLAKSIAQNFKKTDEKIALAINPNRTPIELKEFFNKELIKNGLKAENIEDLSSAKIDTIQARSKEIFLPNESIRMISEFVADPKVNVNVVNYYDDKFYKSFTDSLPVKQISFPRKFLFLGKNTKLNEAKVKNLKDINKAFSEGFEKTGISEYLNKQRLGTLKPVTEKKGIFSAINPFSKQGQMASLP